MLLSTTWALSRPRRNWFKPPPRARARLAAPVVAAILLASAGQASGSCGDYVTIRDGSAQGRHDFSPGHQDSRVAADVASETGRWAATWRAKDWQTEWASRLSAMTQAAAPATQGCQGLHCAGHWPPPVDAPPPASGVNGADQWACAAAGAFAPPRKTRPYLFAMPIRLNDGYPPSLDRPPRA